MDKSILIIAGLDPTGGAGIAADVETIFYHKLSSLPIISVLTSQNTKAVYDFENVSANIIKKQIKHLTNDISFNAIKLSLLGSGENINNISQLLKKYQNLPIVFDPIIKSGQEQELTIKKNIELIKNKIIPYCLLITPNKSELKKLFPNINQKKAAKEIYKIGCPYMLVTATDTAKIMIKHKLYHNGELLKTFKYKKLNNKFHGTGCTLASSICANIVNGYTVKSSCKKGLKYSYKAITNSKKLGNYQLHPNRFI